MSDNRVQTEQSNHFFVLFAELGNSPKVWLRKLRDLFFLVIGYLLSPLSFWNDLFFNLPIAYGIGVVCSWFSPQLLLPATIAAYWLSNIVGILLMQFGALNLFKEESKERNLKKELLTGLVSSTAYSVIIISLVQLKILDTPQLFGADSVINLSSFLTSFRL